MEYFNPYNLQLSKYLFFTGKGGVGKTSIACATAVTLADSGYKVLLISTDPASNLQDVFETELTNKGTPIKEVDNLIVANLDPIEAAKEYKEAVIAPYRGKLPDVVINNMEEQLSGSCTVEIAAFNEFSNFITDESISEKYNYIIFDTAPTGHTLRMLQLPSAWSDFISESTHGASCLGQLSGLEEKKEIYRKAVDTLTDEKATSLILVTRPESMPLIEAERASKELKDIGINNQILIINGVLEAFNDSVSECMYNKQNKALSEIPDDLKNIPNYQLPLRSYNITGIKNVRYFFKTDNISHETKSPSLAESKELKDVIEDLYKSKKKVIFTMGKGGVGKTTIAAAVACGLAEKGVKVHLATTDPAAHLKYVMKENSLITMSHIDEQAELIKYQSEVLEKARKVMSEEDIAYVEEDLRSPCTQEIAVFRAFAQIVEKAENETVIIDTAPTGHTLLLLDSTQSYHREIERTRGDIPESVEKLLPRLCNSDETEVIIVTLAEATPVYEALRLEEDLNRANIAVNWWIINASFYYTSTSNEMLLAKAEHEVEWIKRIDNHTKGKFAAIDWKSNEVNESQLCHFIN